ncbi:MAG: acyl-CoA thioesterase [Flavobacteriaceae bacterium]|nr:acyl-CoA thioesterase [Bacteroidia bacterium]NNK87491.1 acyl-CoA thioesterase [Flavobacteriaceae bacterium]
MKYYTTTLEVEHEDLDALNHVNNVRYVQWVQDVAGAHWNSMATSEMKKRYFWVVIRHTVDYKSPAQLHDFINVRTFVEKSEGATSTRIVEMFNSETDKLIMRAETIWCLISRRSKRPVRITDEIVKLFN